jgi:hypothetical protein
MRGALPVVREALTQRELAVVVALAALEVAREEVCRRELALK